MWEHKSCNRPILLVASDVSQGKTEDNQRAQPVHNALTTALSGAGPMTSECEQKRAPGIHSTALVGPSHLGVVFIPTNFLTVETSLDELTAKRIPRPSAYGLASENIFLIAAGSELAIARP